MKALNMKRSSRFSFSLLDYFSFVHVPPFFRNITQQIKYRLFTVRQKQGFLEDIATLIEDGIPANRAVEIVQKSSTGLLTEVANSILGRLAEGKTFADGMEGWFPVTIVELVRSGEEGGTLLSSLQAAATALGQRSSITSSLITSLTYPAIVVCLAMIVAVFVNHSVFDSFAAIRPIAQWPDNGKTAVALATFIQNGWWLVILAFLGVIFSIGYMLRTYIGHLRPTIDSLPLLSLYRRLVAARFMESLGMLITNGVVFKRSLRILQQNANPYLASHLMAMEFRLSGGKENIAEVLDTGLLDKNDLLRLRIIARGRGFEHALTRQGRKSAALTIDQINLAARIMGGVLLTLGAGLAAFLVMSIYSVGATLSGA